MLATCQIPALRLSKIEGTRHKLQIRVKPGPYSCKLRPLHNHVLKEKKRRKSMKRKPNQQINARGARCCEEAKKFLKSFHDAMHAQYCKCTLTQTSNASVR